MKKYTTIIKWSPKDKCYIAFADGDIELSAPGETPEDALKEFRIIEKLRGNLGLLKD